MSVQKDSGTENVTFALDTFLMMMLVTHCIKLM